MSHEGKQTRAGSAAAVAASGAAARPASGPGIGKRTLVEGLEPGAPIQARGMSPESRRDPAAIRATASRAVAGGGSAVPFASTIQRLFGRHDIMSVEAHAGGDAQAATEELGVQGFATRNRIALRPGADLFTVAHELAHVVQQRAGVQLSDGIGEVDDAHEEHANRVAERVLRGESVEALLDEYGGGGGAGGDGVQFFRGASDLGREARDRVTPKLEDTAAFEKALGIYAYRDARSTTAAAGMIDALTRAVVPDLDAANEEHKKRVVELFGPRDSGAGSAGQVVGNEGDVGARFATVIDALQTGNLRERMTAVYNACNSGFKKEVESLIGVGSVREGWKKPAQWGKNLGSSADWDEVERRGLDPAKLRRRRHQRLLNPAAKDLYRDPGNPLDRKRPTLSALRGATRYAAPEAERRTLRTVGDLDADGIGLSEREKRFMFPAQYAPGGPGAVDAGERLTWQEGGTYWRINERNGWVRECREKLLQPVTAGPSGTALRMFQAWEFLNKPVDRHELRLALLGWMLTGNDHSFHEIMMTCAEYGMAYTPGPGSYHDIPPLTEAELRAMAPGHAFPDEKHYERDHMAPGSQNSVLTTPEQITRLQHGVIPSTADIWAAGAPPIGGDLAKVMAVLAYTDDAPPLGAGHATYIFINNVLQHDHNWFVMRWFVRKDPALERAYKENKFKIRELIEEAHTHERFMRAGLELLKPHVGPVYRGFRTHAMPQVGQTRTEAKFVSMSVDPVVATGFMNKGSGRYHVLVAMQSRTGRALGEVSMYGGGEAEVVFAPGSQFRVTSVTPRATADHLDVTWEEV